MIDEQTIRDTIVGQRVVSVSKHGEELTLGSGITLTLHESYSDCCAAADGSWVINSDNLDAMITDVKFQWASFESGDGEVENQAVITILHNQNQIAQADCYATNGNGGFYASALALTVKIPGRPVFNYRVCSA